MEFPRRSFERNSWTRFVRSYRYIFIGFALVMWRGLISADENVTKQPACLLSGCSKTVHPHARPFRSLFNPWPLPSIDITPLALVPRLYRNETHRRFISCTAIVPTSGNLRSHEHNSTVRTIEHAAHRVILPTCRAISDTNFANLYRVLRVSLRNSLHNLCTCIGARQTRYFEGIRAEWKLHASSRTHFFKVALLRSRVVFARTGFFNEFYRSIKFIVTV